MNDRPVVGRQPRVIRPIPELRDVEDRPTRRGRVLLVQGIPHVRPDLALHLPPPRGRLVAGLVHQRRQERVTRRAPQHILTRRDSGEHDPLEPAVVGVQGPADQVILVPPSPLQQQQPRRLQPRQHVRPIPVPHRVTARLRMRRGVILHGVVDDDHPRPVPGDRLPHRPGQDAPAGGGLPLRDRPGVPRHLKPQELPVLFDLAAHLPSPPGGEVRRVGQQHDGPVRVFPQRPDGEVRGR